MNSPYIQDNGVGIDMNSLRQFGNGLKNMKKRMEDVQIDFSIKNNNGTLVYPRKDCRSFNHVCLLPKQHQPARDERHTPKV